MSDTRVPPTVTDPRPLPMLGVGQIARVVHVASDAELSRRLLEIGFYPGAVVELLACMWPGDDPMAVRVGGSTFALRREEAARVLVAELP